MRSLKLSVILVFLHTLLNAQVISISPSEAFLSQPVTATITLSPGILQAGTPAAIADIYLEQNGNRIYTDAFSVSQIFPGTPPYTDSLTTNFTIPPGAIPGWYDVHVITYAPGPIDNILLNGFVVRLPGSCPVPFTITAETVSGSSEKIKWVSSVTADTYRVRYRLSGTTNYFYKDVNGAGGIDSTIITNLLPNHQYDVDVSTICGGVKSTYSLPVVSFTTLTQTLNCVIPFDISITPVTATTAQVNWSNNVSADTFRIRYYQTPGNYVYHDINGAGPHSFTLTNLLPGTSYNVQLSSVCLGTGNGYSPFMSFVTLAGQANCIVPLGVDTSNVTGSTVNIFWNTSVTSDTFRIKYKKQSGGPDLYKNVNGSLYNAGLQNLDPLTTYIYQVSSVCNGIGTGYSASRTFTTTNTFLPCTTIPFGLTSNATSNSTATVSWTPLVSADSFLVRYSVNGTTNYNWKMVSGTGGNTTTLTGLLPNTTYQWQVRTDCNAAPLTSYSVSDIFGTPLRVSRNNFQEAEVLLFPNPAQDFINLEYSSLYEGNAIIQIMDISGRVVFQENSQTAKGRNFYTTSVAGLPSGYYCLQLIINNTSINRMTFVIL